MGYFYWTPPARIKQKEPEMSADEKELAESLRRGVEATSINLNLGEHERVSTPEEAYSQHEKFRNEDLAKKRNTAADIVRQVNRQLHKVYESKRRTILIQIYSPTSDSTQASLPRMRPGNDDEMNTIMGLVCSELEQNGWKCKVKEGFCGAVYLRIKPGKDVPKQ